MHGKREGQQKVGAAIRADLVRVTHLERLAKHHQLTLELRIVAANCAIELLQGGARIIEAKQLKRRRRRCWGHGWWRRLRLWTAPRRLELAPTHGEKCHADKEKEGDWKHNPQRKLLTLGVAHGILRGGRHAARTPQ